MRLTILGGGAAGVNPGQGCSGYLVESGSTDVVLDLGPGTLIELRKHCQLREIDGIVLSHLHLDHFLDVLALRYTLAYNPIPPPRPLPLLIPPGGMTSLQKLAPALGGSNDAEQFFAVFDLREYDPRATLEIGDLQFRFHRTVHFVPCWAMRVSNGLDGDLFYSADTGPTADLATFAHGCRVVITEGTERGDPQEPAESRGHLTPAEAGSLARQARAKVLVLSHLWAEEHPMSAVIEARRAFGGRVELATPGMKLAWAG